MFEWIHALATILIVKEKAGSLPPSKFAARLKIGADGLLTIALGHGETCRELPLLTGYFGLIGALFKSLWEQKEMDEILETDGNFEILDRSWPAP